MQLCWLAGHPSKACKMHTHTLFTLLLIPRGCRACMHRTRCTHTLDCMHAAGNAHAQRMAPTLTPATTSPAPHTRCSHQAVAAQLPDGGEGGHFPGVQVDRDNGPTAAPLRGQQQRAAACGAHGGRACACAVGCGLVVGAQASGGDTVDTMAGRLLGCRLPPVAQPQLATGHPPVQRCCPGVALLLSTLRNRGAL